MKEYVNDSINFIVGENATDNWKIILAANKFYTWVHADGAPSAHVIIESEDVNEPDIKYACGLCKQHTPKLPNKCRYVCTLVSNIKLGSKPGEVFFKSDKLTYTYVYA